MDSTHQVYFQDARHMAALDEKSIDLVITSPPYPMIEMWDTLFSAADPAIGKALEQCDGNGAFQMMHAVLVDIWREMYRVLKPGGIACINIGDATRTLNGNFCLYPNHSSVVTAMAELGLIQLPAILWRKPTNSPTKFMGSGMLPPSAYVTLEHEYILIFRKGDRRAFNNEDAKQQRRESAYFWEERNVWFSDVWFDLIGAQQSLNSHSSAERPRSGAFPLELPYRLINMFSVAGDRVLDPFAGTGTTMQAAMCTQRHCICYEKDQQLKAAMLEKIASVPDLSQRITNARIKSHLAFVQKQSLSKGNLKYRNRHYGFPVMTRQEEELKIPRVMAVQYLSDVNYKVRHSASRNDWDAPADAGRETEVKPPPGRGTKKRQLKMF